MAIAVDMYGEGKMVDNPEMMPENWRNRFMVMQILQSKVLKLH